MRKKLFSLVREHWSAIYLLASIALLSFLWGVIAVRLEIFPYAIIEKVELQYGELKKYIELYTPKPIEEHPHIILWDSPDSVSPESGVKGTTEGLTFYSGFMGKQFGFKLVDADGKLRYEWTIADSIFDEVRDNSYWKMGNDHYTVQGVHLYANGDVVFNLTEHLTAKIDRCSEVLWTIGGQPHHSIFIDDEDYLWIPGTRVIKDPAEALPHFSTPYREELVYKVTADGKIVETISLLDSIFDSSYQGLVMQGGQGYPSAGRDSLHLNDVEIISAEFAKINSLIAEAGDILVSLKTVDSLAIIDRDTYKIKYVLNGMMLRQHDPDHLDNGNIIIFDNRTGQGKHNWAGITTKAPAFGFSRIIEVNPQTHEIVWSFAGTDQQPFYTAYLGQLDVLDNGNILVTETEGGRIFEVNRNNDEIIWQYRNIIINNDEHVLLGRVTHAERYREDELMFLGSSCGDVNH